MSVYINVITLHLSISDNLIKSEHLLQFVEMGTAKVTEAIEHLGNTPKCQRALQRVVGLLVGIMATTSGHRRCVFLNMRPRDIMGAEKQKDTVTIAVSRYHGLLLV